jgi:hypothetical protein
MNLRELLESTRTKATAAFCFGRFNPPHQGHAKVWEAVAKAGNNWYIGTNPTTTGPNDPLPFDVKTAWMSAIDPNVEGHILGETSVITLAANGRVSSITNTAISISGGSGAASNGKIFIISMVFGG